MTDAAVALQALAVIGLFRQHLQTSFCADDFDVALAVTDGKSGRVISAVFQFFKPFKQDRGSLFLSVICNDSAHKDTSKNTFLL